jgi:hypothetical protein
MAPKKFRDIFPGQIFEIPLKEINKYTYGVVLAGDIRLNKNDDVIIGYINSFTNQSLNFTDVINDIDRKNFVFIANSTITSIQSHRWSFVGSYTKTIMNSDELDHVEYAIKFMDKFYKSVGDPLLPIGDCEKITEDEYKRIPNPLGLAGDLAIEEHLTMIARNLF